MGLFSIAKLFGMTIRESATDGSDFTNPDADYRRLFLGEDEQLHLKDSAGAVTDIGVAATDAIWDAKGDLAVGTGADTAARLAVGANGSYPRAASGETTGLQWQLNNLAASAAPTVNEDSGDGYSVGSRWIDTTADKEYVCLDATVGAAVWTETTGGGGGSVATDAIWDAAGDLAVGSGANTAAALTKGAAGGALSVINSAVAWNSGTAFPANKATGDRYWRTDLGLECYWDGTRWLSVNEYRAAHSLAPAWPITVTAYLGNAAVDEASIYVTRFVVVAKALNTNDGSNYWTLSFVYGNSDSYGSTTGETPDTKAVGASAWARHSGSVAAAITVTNMSINAVKTGNPGNLYTLPAIFYRRIVT